ncbi:MAG: hypothetical protein QNJ65_21490 [Xenococcaceae cyanobacterium MO_234.B1]|nr:hypothetical protein [Xenococcaceae cyanobacterium MO_234.B1]
MILEPLEYCRKWVDMSPEARGYRKVCINALSKATGLSERTIGNWGKDFSKRPDYVIHTLDMANKLKQIREIVLSWDN